MSSKKETNLKKLAKTNLIIDFVKKNDGKWDHQKWLDFLVSLEAKGYAPIDADQVGLLLEEMKEIYLAKKEMQKHIEANVEKGVFETVTGTFKKIMFPDQKDSGLVLQLALINNPHWLAKRDAAYQGAVFLIKNGLISKNSEQRQITYSRISALLNIACKSHNKVLASIKTQFGILQADHIGEYFNLLVNLVNAVSALANVDLIITSQQDNNISSFVGTKGVENLNIINVTCMEDEKKIHESIVTLVAAVEELLIKEENRAKQFLNKVDHIRYDEAFSELKKIYQRDFSDLSVPVKPNGN